MLARTSCSGAKRKPVGWKLRKGWPVVRVHVDIKIVSETKDGTEFLREIRFEGPLDSDQRARLIDIANKCPIHKLLHGPIKVETKIRD